MVEGNDDARYVVVFDPLDGSSNIDASIPTGEVRIFLPSSGTVSMAVVLLFLDAKSVRFRIPVTCQARIP